MDNSIDKKRILDAIDGVSDKLGPDSQKLKNAVESGSLDNILNNLKPQDAKKLQSLLSDKAAAQRLLSTPQAQQLLKNLMNKKD